MLAISEQMSNEVLGDTCTLSFLSDLLLGTVCICSTQLLLNVMITWGVQMHPMSYPTPTLMSWPVVGQGMALFTVP